MARKPAQDKWDAANMASQNIRVRRELLDKFKSVCAERGDAVNGVLREAMEQYVAGDVGSDARSVTLPLDDVIAVCAVLDALNLGDTREDRFIAETRDKLNRLRDAAIEQARGQGQ